MSKFEQAVKLLRHKDPAVRRKAITFLAKSGEPDAAKALGWSAKNDPNADLQQLAQKGVAYLRKQQGQSGGNDVTTGGSLLKYGKKATQTTPAVNDIDEMFSLDEDEQETSDYGSEHGYSAYDSYDPTDDEDHDDSAFDFNFEDEDAVEERTGPLDYDARKKVLAAMDLHIEGDDAGAIESLAEAIAIDSRAAADPKALNVASAATGMAGEKAIRMIRSPIDRSRLIDALDGQAGDDFNFGGGKTKRKRFATSNDKSWSAVWADIGVWALVTVAGIIIVGLLTFVRMQPVLREASTNPQVISELAFALETTYEDTEFFLQQAVTDALSGAILVVIVAAVSFVIFDFVRLFLLGYAYHVTANYMLGGG
ncbi:MAG: HEAT repeat domain-containing protein, partial [Chloroflexota bacterium]